MEDSTRHRFGLAAVLVLIGSLGLASPPGLFGFAVTDCPPAGDCPPTLAPLVFSVLTVVAGLFVAFSTERT